MSETHGLDLKALAATGHSIFAPSGSAMWLTCSGSLIPNLTAPDNAGEDAAEGTVGHTVGETWLNNFAVCKEAWGGPLDMLVDMAEPRLLLDTVVVIEEREASFAIRITEEMLAYVREYVEWCVSLPGDHYIEQRVDFSRLTPIPGQGGTADHGACEPGVLTITDLKYGKGVQVYAEWNTQALLYALGFFYEWDWLYDFQRIAVRICQPRRGHFDVWEIGREDLLAFAEHVKVRAAAAWIINAPRTPSPKGCLWCKIKATCPALTAFTDDMIESKFSDLSPVVIGDDGVIEGSYSVVEMEHGRELTGTPRPPPTLTTAELAKLLPFRKLIEKWFAEIEEELNARAHAGEDIPGFKMVTGRPGNREFPNSIKALMWLRSQGLETDECYTAKLLSPAQAEELLHARLKISKKKAAELIKPWTRQTPGKESLVPVSDKREALDDVSSKFDDLG